MAASYYLYNTAEADPSGAYAREFLLSRVMGPAAEQLGLPTDITSSTAQASRTFRFIESASNSIGSAAGSGVKAYTVKVTPWLANANTTASVFVCRITGAGVQAARVQIGVAQALSAGTKTYSGNADLGTFSGGQDRFLVEVLLATTSTMAQAQTLSISDAGAEVTVPWSFPGGAVAAPRRTLMGVGT